MLNAAKVRHLLRDLLRVNGAYLRDDGYRNDVRERLAPTPPTKRRPSAGGAAQNTSIAPAETAAASEAVRAFDGLVETSLALAGIRMAPTSPARLNLVVGEIREGAAFAGIQTAVTVGRKLAASLGVPLRVVMVSYTTTGNSSTAAASFLTSRFAGLEVEVFAREDIPRATFSPLDFWLVTHWKTAHSVDVAVQAGHVSARRVAYLMQDYEPGFSPWSTEYAIAASTYQHGYEPIVNSEPLREYLVEHENLDIPEERTFAPDLDLDLLRRVADGRRRGDVTRVLFYGRPSKHRNLYRLGITALKIAARRLAAEGIDVEFVSAGEKHRSVELGSGHTLTSVGTLPWNDYFELLTSTNVVLSLQYSPHPSHPPFDAAISGARAVTNDFGGTRGGLHPRIDAVPAEPQALATALVEAVRRDRVEGPGSFVDVKPDTLGGSVESAVESVAAALLARDRA